MGDGTCAIPGAQRLLLASAGADGTVRWWDPAAGTEILTLSGHKASVNDVWAVSGSGRSLLASVSDDRTVRLWDVATGASVRSIPVHHVPLACRYAAGTPRDRTWDAAMAAIPQVIEDRFDLGHPAPRRGTRPTPHGPAGSRLILPRWFGALETGVRPDVASRETTSVQPAL